MYTLCMYVYLGYTTCICVYLMYTFYTLCIGVIPDWNRFSLHLEDSDTKAGVDLDYLGCNMPIKTETHVERFIQLVGQSVNISPKLELVRDIDDDGKNWLQVANHPVVCKLDMSQFNNANRLVIKTGIITALCRAGHMCVPNTDARVSDVHFIPYVYISVPWVYILYGLSIPWVYISIPWVYILYGLSIPCVYISIPWVYILYGLSVPCVYISIPWVYISIPCVYIFTCITMINH